MNVLNVNSEEHENEKRGQRESEMHKSNENEKYKSMMHKSEISTKNSL